MTKSRRCPGKSRQIVTAACPRGAGVPVRMTLRAYCGLGIQRARRHDYFPPAARQMWQWRTAARAKRVGETARGGQVKANDQVPSRGPGELVRSDAQIGGVSTAARLAAA